MSDHLTFNFRQAASISASDGAPDVSLEAGPIFNKNSYNCGKSLLQGMDNFFGELFSGALAIHV